MEGEERDGIWGQKWLKRETETEMLLEKGEEVREVGEVSSLKGKGYCLTRT